VSGALPYLVIGHITVDHTPFGREWGGTALFASVTALRLGATVYVLTSVPEEGVAKVIPDGIAVKNVPSPVWCTFTHEFVNGVREQYVTDIASILRAEDVPADWKDIPLVHFGPLAQEIDHDLLAAFKGSLRGASVQGWLREWGEDRHVHPLGPEKMLAWVPPVDISFLSEEDIGGERAVIDLYRANHRIVVLTDGNHGATVFEGPSATQIPAFPVHEVDANGAGDVFSAAFLIRYYKTRDAVASARFAAVVASFHVEHHGTRGIPTLEQAEQRLLEYASL
jgi:1D-myo-inositol 3-kinase